MTELTADFETGTGGNAIATTDPGSASAWDAVVISGGAAILYDGTTQAHGALSAYISIGGTPGSTYLRWSSGSLGTLTDFYNRIYFRTSVVNATRVLAAGYNGTTLGWYLYTDSTGHIGIDKGVGGTTPPATTATISADTWYRVEFRITHGAGNTGSIELKLFTEIDSNTAADTVTSPANMGMGDSTDNIRFGIGCGVAAYNATTVYMDDLAAGAESYPGPVFTSQLLVAAVDSVDGNWHDEGGGTDLTGSIGETTATDTDYIVSELHPSASGCRVKLASGTDPNSSTGHVIHWRLKKTSATGEQINGAVKLYQGGGNVQGAGTLIASFDRTNVGGSAFTTYDETLSSGEADSISDYSDLYLEFYATAS